MADPAPKFKLTKAAINSQVWMELMNHFKDRIAKLRADNDQDLDVAATAKMRGRIAEIRALMMLDKDFE